MASHTPEDTDIDLDDQTGSGWREDESAGPRTPRNVEPWLNVTEHAILDDPESGPAVPRIREAIAVSLDSEERDFGHDLSEDGQSSSSSPNTTTFTLSTSLSSEATTAPPQLARMRLVFAGQEPPPEGLARSNSVSASSSRSIDDTSTESDQLDEPGYSQEASEGLGAQFAEGLGAQFAEGLGAQFAEQEADMYRGSEYWQDQATEVGGPSSAVEAAGSSIDSAVYDLPCEFALLDNCRQRFRHDQIEEWMYHIEHVHLRDRFPHVCICWFCDQYFDTDQTVPYIKGVADKSRGSTRDRHRNKDRDRGRDKEQENARRKMNFEERLRHVADHIKEGYNLGDSMPDFDLIRFCRRHHILDDDRCQQLLEYQQGPARRKFERPDFIPPEQAARLERESMQSHDQEKEDRERRRHRDKGKEKERGKDKSKGKGRHDRKR